MKREPRAVLITSSSNAEENSSELELHPKRFEIRRLAARTGKSGGCGTNCFLPTFRPASLTLSSTDSTNSSGFHRVALVRQQITFLPNNLARKCHQLAIVPFRLENPDSRDCENVGESTMTNCQCSLLLREPRNPIKHIAKNKIVLCRVHLVLEVPLAPFQIFFRQVQARRMCTRLRSRHGKPTGIRKRVQYLERFPACRLASEKLSGTPCGR